MTPPIPVTARGRAGLAGQVRSNPEDLEPMTSSRKLSAKDLSAVSGGAAKKGPTMASQGRAPGSAATSAAKTVTAPTASTKKPKK